MDTATSSFNGLQTAPAEAKEFSPNGQRGGRRPANGRGQEIARYATGRSAAPFPVLARLAEGVDVSLDWVALGTGTMLRAGRAEAAGPGLPVGGLRPLTGAGEWYAKTALSVRLPAHPGLAAEDTMVVMAPDDRLRGDGVAAGHVCYCVAGLPPLPDDLVYVEQADGKAALRRLVDSSEGILTLADAGGAAERLPLCRVTRLAPVVLVRRKW